MAKSKADTGKVTKSERDALLFWRDAVQSGKIEGIERERLQGRRWRSGQVICSSAPRKRQRLPAGRPRKIEDLQIITNNMLILRYISKLFSVTDLILHLFLIRFADDRDMQRGRGGTF